MDSEAKYGLMINSLWVLAIVVIFIGGYWVFADHVNPPELLSVELNDGFLGLIWIYDEEPPIIAVGMANNDIKNIHYVDEFFFLRNGEKSAIIYPYDMNCFRVFMDYRHHPGHLMSNQICV